MRVNLPDNAIQNGTDQALPALSFDSAKPGQFDHVLGDVPFNGGPTDLAFYFQLQVKIAQETLFFNTISNIVKARQDASMNSVRNMKQ
ncbi:MAG TPA: hypothetical protein PK413_07785 [Thermoanaerobaculia bacterium]|nr:hypothetical protein [Thermoanaerobaculia bacterium]